MTTYAARGPGQAAEEDALVQQFVGRTVTGARYWEDPHGMGGGVEIAFADGSVLEIEGWGHDWWGVYVNVKTATREETR